MPADFRPSLPDGFGTRVCATTAPRRHAFHADLGKSQQRQPARRVAVEQVRQRTPADFFRHERIDPADFTALDFFPEQFPFGRVHEPRREDDATRWKFLPELPRDDLPADEKAGAAPGLTLPATAAAAVVRPQAKKIEMLDRDRKSTRLNSSQ